MPAVTATCLPLKVHVPALPGGKRGVHGAAHQRASCRHPLSPQDAEQTKELIEAEGVEALLIAQDLSTGEEAARSVVQKVVDRFGRVDVLVNNASMQHKLSSIEDTDAEYLESTFKWVRGWLVGGGRDHVLVPLGLALPSVILEGGGGSPGDESSSTCPGHAQYPLLKAPFAAAPGPTSLLCFTSQSESSSGLVQGEEIVGGALLATLCSAAGRRLCRLPPLSHLGPPPLFPPTTGMSCPTWQGGRPL